MTKYCLWYGKEIYHSISSLFILHLRA